MFGKTPQPNMQSIGLCQQDLVRMVGYWIELEYEWLWDDGETDRSLTRRLTLGTRYDNMKGLVRCYAKCRADTFCNKEKSRI